MKTVHVNPTAVTGKCSALSKNFNPDLDKDYLKETGIQAQQDFPGVSVEVTKLLMRFNRISKVLVLIILPKWIKLKPQAQQIHQEQSPQFPYSPKSSCPLPTPFKYQVFLSDHGSHRTQNNL